MKFKDEYEKLIEQILYYFNPCKTEQLIKALTKSFKDLDKDKAEKILKKYQSCGKILFSEDGWALTKGRYTQLTDDTRYNHVDTYSPLRLNYMGTIIENQCDLRLVNCLWIMLEYMPDSLDYTTLCKPFNLTFLANKKLFQIIYIRNEDEERKIEVLKMLPTPSVYTDKKTNETYTMKDNIVRIVILENENHGWKIPEGIGIKYICAIDNDKEKHYRIVEKRKNIW